MFSIAVQALVCSGPVQESWTMGNKNSIYNIDLKDSFLSDAINAHNKHRADHKCPPLQHADDLSELANKIAYYTSTRNKDLKDRLSKDRIENTHGENTALKILTTNQDYSGKNFFFYR